MQEGRGGNKVGKKVRKKEKVKKEVGIKLCSKAELRPLSQASLVGQLPTLYNS